MRARLSIITYLHSERLAQSLRQFLNSDRYALTQTHSPEEFLDLVEQQKQSIDCLILQDDAQLLLLVNRLKEQGTLLPLLILQLEPEKKSDRTESIPKNQDSTRKRKAKTVPAQPPPSSSNFSQSPNNSFFYHSATVLIPTQELPHLPHYIDQTITKFLDFSCPVSPSDSSSTVNNDVPDSSPNILLSPQQRRLADKLRERLGYLGVYYKRNPQQFFRYFTPSEKQTFLARLRLNYRQIVLNYFAQDSGINQEIDELVNLAFFSDLSVTQIVEIHMELMDELSKQLKLEGRNEEILLDYRLTLIDVIAHLCEMYRRSIPRDS